MIYEYAQLSWSQRIRFTPNTSSNKYAHDSNRSIGADAMRRTVPTRRLLEALSSFLSDVPRGLLMQLWGAALNGRTSTKDRICRYRCACFCVRFTQRNSHSQSTAYWQFLSRESRPHLRIPNFYDSQWLNLLVRRLAEITPSRSHQCTRYISAEKWQCQILRALLRRFPLLHPSPLLSRRILARASAYIALRAHIPVHGDLAAAT